MKSNIIHFVLSGLISAGLLFCNAAAQPAAHEIIFHSDAIPSVRSQIYSVRADGTGQFDLSNDPSWWYQYPNWSPDGTKIVYTDSETIWMMDADGSKKVKIFGTSSSIYTPVWSPDGRSIAFVHDGHGFGAASIRIFEFNGELRWLTDIGPHDSSGWIWDYGLSWSPDGSKIVFSRVESDGRRINIYTINEDGSGEIALTQASDLDFYINPSWSPDGSTIAFTAATGPDYLPGTDIFVMNADGSNRRRITYLRTYAMFPSWSPDGEKIVFSANAGFDPPFNIYSINRDGTGLVQITRNPFDSLAPHWRRLPTLSISGRVVSRDGHPLRNATVTAMAADGNRHPVLTSSLGFYRITGLIKGETYVVVGASKRFRFSPRTVVMSDSDLTDVDLVGQE